MSTMTRRRNRSSDDTSSKSTLSGDPFRHLDDKLAGVIFGCTDDTYDECIKEGVFGLPMGHISYVQGIKLGTPIFLFNYSRRELHGVFAAASTGQINLRPHGWTSGTTEKTSFPAQVRVRRHKKGTPLKEHQFKKAIQQNYDCDGPLFQFELDEGQVKLLCQLFKSTVPRTQRTKPITPKPPPVIQSHVAQRCHSVDDNKVNVAAQKPLSQCTTRPMRLSSRRSRRPLIPSSSGTEKNESSVLQGPNDKRSSGRRSQKNLTNTRSYRSTISPAQSVKVSPGPTGLTPQNQVGLPVNYTLLRRPRRTLGEANGILSEAAVERLDGKYRTKKSLSLSEPPSRQRREVLPPQDDLLTQFLQSTQKDERFFAHETEDTLLLIGGIDEEDSFSRIEVLQEDRQSWKVSLFIPNLRTIGSRAVSINDCIILLGGEEQEHESTCAVEMLKSGWKRWKSMQPMPHARQQFSACPLGSMIFTVGGGNAFREMVICEYLDDNRNSWMPAPSLIQGRYGCASCSSASVLFAAGGGRRSTVLSTVEMLDDRCGKWQKIPSMNAARKHHAMISFQDELWVLGGEDSEGAYLSSVEAYDLRNQQWKAMPSLMNPRAYFTAEVLDNTLHVLGGSSSANVADFRILAGEQYSCGDATWIEGLSVGSTGKRGHHTSCVIRASHSMN